MQVGAVAGSRGALEVTRPTDAAIGRRDAVVDWMGGAESGQCETADHEGARRSTATCLPVEDFRDRVRRQDAICVSLKGSVVGCVELSQAGGAERTELLVKQAPDEGPRFLLASLFNSLLAPLVKPSALDRCQLHSVHSHLVFTPPR